MALRIKSQWHKEEAERSLEEIGGAIAFNAWRIALDKAIHLHGERFIYQDDRQRLDVIAEHLIFQAQVAERQVRGMLDDEQRRTLVTAAVLKMAEHLQDNAREILGEGDERGRFVERFNQRGAEYAELNFTDEGPSYPFYRHLGYEIQQVMGSDQENRWVIDQVMDLDGPEVFRQMQRIVRNLFM